MPTARPKQSRRASFSVVDTLSMARLSRSEDLKRSSSSKEEDAGATAASTVSGDDNASTQSYSHNASSPRRRGRRSLLGLGRTLSRMSLGLLLDENNQNNKSQKQSDNLLGCSSNSLTSLGMDDSMDMTPFEMEMKARSLLTDVRKRIQEQKKHEQELITSITRHTELALARSSGVGALISMKKVKKQQLELGRVASAIGYLETHELDLMADIEEAKQQNLEKGKNNHKDYEWPVYEDFESELEYMLAPASEKESLAWTDDELLHDLAKLRRAPQRAARHYSMD